MAENNLERLLRQGIDAAKQGNNATARRLLEAVIAQDDSNELAWIWLASVVATVRERRFCLEKVLQINPANSRARDALNALVGVGAEATRNANDLTRAAATATSARTGGSVDIPFNLSSPLVRIGAVVAALVVAVLVLQPLFQRPRVDPTPVAVFSTATPNYTPTPRPSPTFNGIFVTPRPRDLPATWTPTFTPTPTQTPLPTATPIPFGEFLMLVPQTNADGTIELYQYRGDGTGESRLAADARDIAFSRDGQQVVFVRDVTYPAEGERPETTVGEIFTAPLNDLASAGQVSNLRTADARTPRFSPDNRQIIFTSDFDGDDELWLLDPNTRITSQLTYNTAADRDADFAPDGTRLIFVSDRDSPGLSDLYLLTFVQNPPPPDPNAVSDAGHTVIRLVDQASASYAPVWSPDGTRILYINDQEGDGDVYTVTADGTRISSLFVSADTEERAPVWAADGRRIVFLSNREDERFQVYALDPATDALTRLLTTERDALSVVFQPNAAFRLP